MSEPNHHPCEDPHCSCHAHSAETPTDETPTDETPTDASDESQNFELPQDVPLPTPSLLTLATSITSQAMVSMGIFPHPITGKSEFLFHQAQHLIDTVDLLFQKTEGNRTEEETKMMEQMLHEMRMLFIAAKNEKNRRDADSK